ncbi:histone deacetylase [Thiohalorhabdus denitrificans]|uniref:Acetoin utilization protein AcuC n=1 Tax=Thiohalorhabdus denitrificans TaxID=381306 RepID=A0A0P9CE44_9GAMM|nr:acetoin utilization protein AcuC [Thiohalorhabdus denitrificans]KPV41106.1 histone deacetylase [Thiohalorhabdus denitrificans]SCY38182.1 acetoin utilization protein AcuC [Thiohalorhabdus denitrificans]
MTGSAVFFGAARYRRPSYNDNHPLGIPRVSLTVDLLRAYGALPEAEYQESRQAADYELAWFHTQEYLRAARRIEASGRASAADRKRYNLGNLENPAFAGFYTTAAIATGASIQAAEAVIGGRIGFNPAGGMHHAAPHQARGFCYFNDPVLGILRLRREGWRVLYVDLDAHHGDGVEDAFATDPEVFTLSLHMGTERAYPFQGGGLDDRGQGPGEGYALNLPMPAGAHDDDYRTAFEAVWGPVVDRFQPDAVVFQAGTDILLADPLSRFRVSTQTFLAMAARIQADSAPRLLVTGGGGYHPLALARCWAGLWAQLSGRELPVELPPAGREHLEAVDWDLDEDEDWFDELFRSRLDPPQRGRVKPEVEEALDHLHRHHPFFRRAPVGVTGAAANTPTS